MDTNRKRAMSLVAAVVASSVLAGCSLPGAILRYGPADANITGIRSVLDAGKHADVVLVHGMCYHDADWVKDSNTRLADALGLTVSHSAASPIPIGPFGGMLYTNELRGPRGELVRSFAILWSPVSAAARGVLCYDTSSQTDSCKDTTGHLNDPRATVNALLKNDIMDGCLSDAVYAVGKDGVERLGSTIDAGLARAIAGGQPLSPQAELTLSPARDETAPLFVVTESLGSKLFVDAAIRLASRSCEAFGSMAATMKRTAQIFMEANQIPILTLAYNPPLENQCPTEAAQSTSHRTTGFAALVELRQSGPKREQTLAMPLKVAAFSDPNDILSYTLVPAPDLPSGLEVVDIVLANDWAWLNFFENPYAAHTTYGTKCRVQKVIADGTAGLKEYCAALR